MKKFCKDCVHSRWNLTPTGKPKRESTGRCVVPTPRIPLPVCITDYFSYNPEPSRSAINQNREHDCPLYLKRDGPPKAIGAAA